MIVFEKFYDQEYKVRKQNNVLLSADVFMMKHPHKMKSYVMILEVVSNDLHIGSPHLFPVETIIIILRFLCFCVFFNKINYILLNDTNKYLRFIIYYKTSTLIIITNKYGPQKTTYVKTMWFRNTHVL